MANGYTALAQAAGGLRTSRTRIVNILLFSTLLCFLAWVSHSKSTSVSQLHHAASGWFGSRGLGLWENYANDNHSTIFVTMREQEDVMYPGVRRVSWGGMRQQGAKASMRDNLIPEKQYMLIWGAGGFNNQVIRTLGQLFICKLTNRIPILAPFTPNFHLSDGGRSETQLATSDVFDMHYLRTMMGDLPLIEHHEVKLTHLNAERNAIAIYDGENPQVNPINGQPFNIGDKIEAEAPEQETLGCWSFFETLQVKDQHGPNDEGWLSIENLPLPAKVYDDGPWRPNFLKFRDYLLNDFKRRDFSASYEFIANNSLKVPEIEPDWQLICLDNMHYFGENSLRSGSIDELTIGVGAWNEIGRYMRFQPGLVKMAEDHLRHLWGLRSTDHIPPYMSVHIRRGDFSSTWIDMPPSTYIWAAESVMKTILRNEALKITRVVLTSDEEDPVWLSPFMEAGWTYINHTYADTSARFGSWLPTLLDGVILAGGRGFLGVAPSTVSVTAYRRVIDWNKGVGRLLRVYERAPEGWEWDSMWVIDPPSVNQGYSGVEESPVDPEQVLESVVG